MHVIDDTDSSYKDILLTSTMTILSLRPSDIRYSQDSIASYFGYGIYSGRPIGESLDELIQGRCRVRDIPTITVQSRDGLWYTADNRRLWIFRKGEELDMIQEVQVQEGYVNPSKFTTYNRGVSIRVRGNPGGYRWTQKRRKELVIRDPEIPTPAKPVIPVMSFLTETESETNVDVVLNEKTPSGSKTTPPEMDYESNTVVQTADDCTTKHLPGLSRKYEDSEVSTDAYLCSVDLTNVPVADQSPTDKEYGHDNPAYLGLEDEDNLDKQSGHEDQTSMNSDRVSIDVDLCSVDLENVSVDNQYSTDGDKDKSSVVAEHSTADINSVDVESGETLQHAGRCMYIRKHPIVSCVCVVMAFIVLAVLIILSAVM